MYGHDIEGYYEYTDVAFEAQEPEGLQTSLGEERSDGLPVSANSNPWFQFFVVMLALVFVLFLAYYASRVMGRGSARVGGRQRNLKIVEAIAVGPQNTLQIVQAGDKYFVVGVSRQGIVKIGEVDGDSINTEEPSRPSLDNPFEKYLSRFAKKKDDADKDNTQSKE